MTLKWILLLALVGVIAASNPEEESNDPNAFEGDIILTPEQKTAMNNGQRGSITHKKWPGGVMVYTIESSLATNSRAMKAIRDGMNEWTSNTCIRFKERTNEQNYAHFKSGRGCSSYVGLRGGMQPITLASGCRTKGIVAHEIGHALGFYHEQSRPDRDQYVTIVWENIKSGKESNFKLRSSINSLGSPYDYGSVMHYRSTSFSKNGQKTIIAKQSGVTLGQRLRLSPEDAKQMNSLYKGTCSGGGGGTPPTQRPPQPPPPTRPPPPPPPGNCKDDNAACPGWTSLCKSHATIKNLCKKSCNAC